MKLKLPAAVQPPLHYRTVRWFLWRRQTWSASWQLSSSRPLDNSVFSNLPPLQTSPMAVFPSLKNSPPFLADCLERKYSNLRTYSNSSRKIWKKQWKKHVLIQTQLSCPVSLHQELRLLRVWCKNQQSWAIIFLRPQRKTVVCRSLWWQSDYLTCSLNVKMAIACDKLYLR